ncbi:MAG: P63C domain-containing protein [Solirubrobacterales bacterium]
MAKELQAYIKTFPPDFYSEMFRLRGLDYPNGTVKRPQYFGNLTNDIVYKRLAPGVLEELRRVTPRDPKGRPQGQVLSEPHQQYRLPEAARASWLCRHTHEAQSGLGRLRAEAQSDSPARG